MEEFFFVMLSESKIILTKFPLYVKVKFCNILVQHEIRFKSKTNKHVNSFIRKVKVNKTKF